MAAWKCAVEQAFTIEVIRRSAVAPTQRPVCRSPGNHIDSAPASAVHATLQPSASVGLWLLLCPERAIENATNNCHPERGTDLEGGDHHPRCVSGMALVDAADERFDDQRHDGAKTQPAADQANRHALWESITDRKHYNAESEDRERKA